MIIVEPVETVCEAVAFFFCEVFTLEHTLSEQSTPVKYQEKVSHLRKPPPTPSSGVVVFTGCFALISGFCRFKLPSKGEGLETMTY